jgi:hypothetical protein
VTPVKSQIQVVREILKWIWDNKGEPWKVWSAGSPEAVLYDQLAGVLPPIGNLSEYEKLLPSASSPRIDFAPTRKFLYLRSPARGDAVLPVLTACFDFDRSLPEVRLQTALFALQSSSPAAIGVRYETPEGIGLHSYFHAQPFKAFAKGPPLPSAPPWLPTSTPTIPLDASTPVQLLVCLVASLYGYTDTAQLVGDVWELKEHAENMSMWRVQPQHWKVTRQRQSDLFIRTWRTEVELRAWVRQHHSGATVAKCKPADFDGAQQSARVSI